MKMQKILITGVSTLVLASSVLSFAPSNFSNTASASSTPAISKKAIKHLNKQVVSYKSEEALINKTPKLSIAKEYQYKLKKGIYIFKLWWSPQMTALNRITGEKYLPKGTVVSAYQVGTDGQDWSIATPKYHRHGSYTYTTSLGTSNASVLKGNHKKIHNQALKVLGLGSK